MPPQKENLGVSTGGNRKRNERDTIQQATNRVLKQVENHSAFFDQVEPYTLPEFDRSEIQLGESLGRGEFGDVLEVKSIQIEFECPCVTCGTSSTQLSLKPFNSIMVTPRNDSPLEIIVDETWKPDDTKESPGPSSIAMPSALNQHRRAISAVSFAEDVKPPENGTDSHRATMNTEEHNFIDDSDNSTLSTEDEESVTNMLEDEDTDGEVPFIRGYMSTHTTRQGIARYAIKRARQDLTPKVLLEAVVDLAVEAKFLATIRHPNIVKMRGTVGNPGSVDFMIIMDRLKMTLREKMRQWNEESKGKTGILRKLLRPSNRASQQDQYADKLLAVYDIARAMKYLHNHMIIYRDLKPENVAFDVRGDMRLFDFGLAKELKAKDLVEHPDGFAATGLTGSRRYMAPEVCSCKHYGLKADVYSFAIVFWEVFSGQEAYYRMSFNKHFDHVVVNHKRPNPKTAAVTTRNLSKSLLHLMPEMWSSKPQDRPTFRSICDRLTGECILSSNQQSRNLEGGNHKDSDRSHQSFVTDRTRYLMNRSLRSRYASDADSSGSRVVPGERHR